MPRSISRIGLRSAAIVLAALAVQALVLWLAQGFLRAQTDRGSAETIATLVTTAGARSVRAAMLDLMDRAEAVSGRVERAIDRLPVIEQTSAAIKSALRTQLDRTRGAAAIHFASSSTSYIVSSGSADRMSAGAMTPPVDVDAILLDLAREPMPKARLVGYFADTSERARPRGDAWLYVATPIHVSPHPNQAKGEAVILAFHAATAISDAIDCLLPGCHLTFRPKSADVYYDSLRRLWLPITTEVETNHEADGDTNVSGPLPGSLTAEIHAKLPARSPTLFLLIVTGTAIVTALAIFFVVQADVRGAKPSTDEIAPPEEAEIAGASAAISPAGMFKRLINANATPILVVDSGLSTIAYANPAAVSLLQTTSDDPVAKPFSRFFRLAPDILTDLLAQGGQADRVQICGHDNDLFADLRFGPARIDGKNWTMVVVADARAAMEAERTAMQAREQLDQALKRRLDGIGKQRDNYRRMVDTLKGFTSTLAHEIKNPIAVIMAAAQNLATSSDPDAVRRATRIEARAKDMTTVINRVLTAARIEANALAPVLGEANSLALLRAHVETASEHDRKHVYVLAIDDLRATSLLDRDLLGLALNNLLGNAAKYSPDGSTISVHGRVEQTVTVIRIVDHGIGIPDPEKERIFTRYYRASSAVEAGIPGNGLGMALCKEILEMLDASITIEDTDGGGTTVCITLPLASEIPREAA